MHAQAFKFVAEVVHNLHPKGPVYEIGSRNINGTVRGLFKDCGLYVGIDSMPGPDVDLMENGATYTPPITPATVVCCEVLEHTAEAEAIVKKAADVLAEDGHLIITCAGHGRVPHSAIDGGEVRPGEYYQNIAADTLVGWATAAGLDTVRVSETDNPGDLYFVGQKRHAPKAWKVTG
jgi:hypothetical protein